MNTEPEYPRANVLGLEIDAVNMDQALDRIAHTLRLGRKGYVCLAGVHGVMECVRNSSLANIFADATLVAPDGMPTVWVGHYQGHREMEQVTGPDLMLEVLSRDEFHGLTHFLYGGKAGIANELREQLTARYPSVQIVGTYSPPFGPLSPAQEREFVSMIGRLRPDIIWVGISTPKQERFMSHYLPMLDTKLMFGVGAAFDFHTGRISDCSRWIKRAGLQWVHRLLQDPKHLWKRYLRNNPAFLFHIFFQLTGLRSWQPQPSSACPTSQQQPSPTIPQSSS